MPRTPLSGTVCDLGNPDLGTLQEGTKMASDTDKPEGTPEGGEHKRRVRYSGTHPRHFEEKYKELQPERYVETVQKVMASGKTPAGTHRPIMVDEILSVLLPKAGERVVDVTLGWGGHTQALLDRIQPGGHLLGLDCDPLELPKTEARLRGLGYGPEVFTAHRSNYAGLPQALALLEWEGADCILADLGVSSMQLDDPSRGFSVKLKGPLDMRMNPRRGRPASVLLERIDPHELAVLLADNSDEPNAEVLGKALAGRQFSQTTELAAAIKRALPRAEEDQQTLSVRRVFQALRIAVNDEFPSLETFLRFLPSCLRPHGRVAILTFHSGEDRRVKKAFKEGLASGHYASVSEEVTRATSAERRDNPRSSSAKLRWAIRSFMP